MEAILGLVVIYLFIRFVMWAFATVVPYTVVGTLVLGVIFVSYAYGKMLFDMFKMRGRLSPSSGNKKHALWSCAISVYWFIVFLMFHDLFNITLVAFFNFFDEPSIFAIQRSKSFLAAFWAEAHLIDVSNALLPRFPAPWTVTLSGALPIFTFRMGAKMLSILLLSFCIRGMKSKTLDPSGKEPAKLQYFFHDAYKDLSNIPTRLYDVFHMLLLYFKAKLFKCLNLFTFPLSIFTFPIPIAAGGVLLLIAAVAIPVFLFILTLHFLVIAVICVSFYYVALFLHVWEKAVLYIRSSYAKCPYAGCHTQISRPVYVCGCGAYHKNLIPGKYGILKRECQCGRKLPTLAWFGKDKLAQRCPSCDKAIQEKLFASNVHIPIYGGPSAGKSSFMLACLYKLMESPPDGVNIDFIDNKDANTYSSMWKPAFLHGKMLRPDKTHDMQPDAVLLSMRRALGLPTSVYFYDPAGEVMTQEKILSKHTFLQFFDGLIVILDPYSLQSIAKAYQAKTGKSVPNNVSTLDPRNLLESIVNVLEEVAGLDRGKKFPKKIAILINKVDDPFIWNELGLKADNDSIGENWVDICANSSEKIKEWLIKNEPSIYQIIAVRFSEARFFAVSSLGENPAEGKPNVPQGVLNPFLWLISRRETLRHPRRTLLLSKLTEYAAVAAIFMIFFMAPFIAGKTFVPDVFSGMAAYAENWSVLAPDPSNQPNKPRSAPVPESANSPRPAPASRQTGTIAGNNVNIRSGPSTNNNVLYRLNRGATVAVLDKRQVRTNELWYLIEPQSRKQGWVRSDLLRLSR